MKDPKSRRNKTACGTCSRKSESIREAEYINNRIAHCRGKSGNLISVLQDTQRQFGYISESAIRHISKGLDEPVGKVFGVTTFYSFFSRTPRGKYLIRICMGTACYVRGAQKILDAIRKELRIDMGQTTPDALFTLDVARCFGACGLAPAIMINETIYQRVKPSQVRRILAEYRPKETEHVL